jgi:hypothetical protein
MCTSLILSKVCVTSASHTLLVCFPNVLAPPPGHGQSTNKWNNCVTVMPLYRGSGTGYIGPSILLLQLLLRYTRVSCRRKSASLVVCLSIFCSGNGLPGIRPRAIDVSKQPYMQGPAPFDQTTGVGSPRCGMCSSVGLQTTALHPYLGGSRSDTYLSSRTLPLSPQRDRTKVT